jgi:UPF0755 protein
VKKLLLFVLVIGAAGFAATRVASARLAELYKGYPGEYQVVDVPSGASPRTIGVLLVGAGVVRDPLTFRVALWLSGDARRLQAGEYRFDRPMSVGDVIGKISRGEVDLLSVTFPEGLTIEESARIFESHGLGSAAEFLQAARDPAPIRSVDAAAPDLEGYVFPETYAVPRSIGARGMVHAMVQRFTAELTPDMRAAAAAKGWTVRQLVTLASIVEKETARPDERPLVAAVYANRLKIGMGLQCDPTVIYALQKAGGFDGNLRKDDLQFDSPYNTYRYPGLPPGPIAAPGRASLEAAAKPADVPYLYFVSRNDGSHAFASTLADHNRNVREFQVLYFRQRRAQGR